MSTGGPRATYNPITAMRDKLRLKRRLAALALTCAEAARVSETCGTTQADIQGDFAQALCSVAMLISPEVTGNFSENTLRTRIDIKQKGIIVYRL